MRLVPFFALPWWLLLGGCEGEPTVELRAEPVTTVEPRLDERELAPEDPPPAPSDSSCDARPAPRGPVRIHLETMSLDELVEVLPGLLGGCVEVAPSLLHRYRCLEARLAVDAPDAAGAFERVARALAAYGLSLERDGGSITITAPPEAEPCPDGFATAQ